MPARRTTPVKVAAVLAAAMFVLGGAYVGAERLVEGHSVIMHFDKVNTRQGFDIAGLVKEGIGFPNILWFNDQWKTFTGGNLRMPCGGFVLAMSPQSGAQPKDPSGTASYRRSYHITDPNGVVTDTHLYSIRFNEGGSVTALVSSILNNWVEDDGVSECNPWLDNASPHDDPGSNGVPYYDNGDGQPIRAYNFDIYGIWGDIGSGSGTKRHGQGAANNGDGTGCEAGTEWECGPGGDDAEGNSHPYNPYEPDSGPQHSHSVRRVDLWFFSENPDPARIPPPVPRYEIYDTEAVESEQSICRADNGTHVHC